MNTDWWVGPEQLDDDQKTVITLPLEGSHLVIGPPGSGKTNLLLLRANYMAYSGYKNIMIIVFTRTLQDYIISGAANYAFPHQKIKTCCRWQLELLYEYGEKVELPSGTFQKQRTFLADKLNHLIVSKNLSDIYDAIFLDESQDYTPVEIEIFKKLGKVLFAVADARQKIYAGADSSSTIKGAVDYVHKVRFHYRNGLWICKFADAIAKDSADYEKLEPTSNYDETARPSSVEHFICRDLDDQAKKIIEKLRIQLKAYPDELLSVISPTKEVLSRIWGVIQQTDIAKNSVSQDSDEYFSLGGDSRIFFCSLHAVKGLEARAVHLAGCEFLKKFPHQRNMAFTAATRAKTSLSLYSSGDLPGFLEQALQSLKPLPNLPDIGDVFRKDR